MNSRRTADGRYVMFMTEYRNVAGHSHPLWLGRSPMTLPTVGLDMKSHA